MGLVNRALISCSCCDALISFRSKSGLCKRCYNRKRSALIRKEGYGVCKSVGCLKKAIQKKSGLCYSCHRKALRTGDIAKDYIRCNISKEYPHEYSCWCEIKTRCSNHNRQHNECYARNKITVCERWTEKRNGFRNFLEDMGTKPSYKLTRGGHPVYTIDRIDPLGGYTPENCRWATTQEQAINKSNIKHLYITYDKSREKYLVRMPWLHIGRRFMTLNEAENFRNRILQGEKDV